MRKQLKIAVAIAACVAIAGCAGAVTSRPTAPAAGAAKTASSAIPFSQLASLSVNPTEGTRPVVDASAADQDAARSVVDRSLDHDNRVVRVLSTSDHQTSIPKQWWASHRSRPYKLVDFLWGNVHGGIGAFGTAAAVQATPDSTWTILYSTSGY